MVLNSRERGVALSCVFASGDKRSAGEGRLGAGHPHPSGDPARGLRQRTGGLHPPLLWVGHTLAHGHMLTRGHMLAR